MATWRLTLDDNAHDEVVWLDLQNKGYTPLYGEQGEAGHVLVITAPDDALEALLRVGGVFSAEPIDLPEIDWQQQWQEHAPGFDEGKLTVDLGEYGTIVLKPGPGFGDLSHPTTRLVLELMAEQVDGKAVVDVGCGSGILSIAAQAMGAASVVGIDIDEAALVHARDNASLNGMEEIEFRLPGEAVDLPGECVAVMNMIRSEQRQAWPSVPAGTKVLITSGVLVEEAEGYVEELAGEWQLVHRTEREGWVGFLFGR